MKTRPTMIPGLMILFGLALSWFQMRFAGEAWVLGAAGGVVVGYLTAWAYLQGRYGR